MYGNQCSTLGKSSLNIGAGRRGGLSPDIFSADEHNRGLAMFHLSLRVLQRQHLCAVPVLSAPRRFEGQAAELVIKFGLECSVVVVANNDDH